VKAAIALLALLVVSSGYFINESFAEISENTSMGLQGSGFAVTEEVIQNSEIDFILFSEQKNGNKINFKIENGFVTLGNEDFTVFDISGTFLRDGKYLRISGTANNVIDEVKINFFGRLIEDSNEGSVYSFTGRITSNDISYKILYVSKLSKDESITKTETIPEKGIIIHISKGSYDQGFDATAIDRMAIEQQAAVQNDSLRARYFSQDRLTLEPGTSITFVNDDIVSHKILSGAGLGQSTRVNQTFTVCDNPQTLPKGFSFDYDACSFTLDGRIQSDDIQPGDYWTATFNDVGTYKLMDTDYPWMNMIVQIFPDVDNDEFGKSDRNNQTKN